ncbi:MAG: biotin/lipoyl-binding protein [Candidatus Thermochlorobacter aerophilum]|jgi:biotin carboxyl carrier protein|uniref:Biotin/lipoyl-binding protein n=1 Tax=Candidatus Thermochlorobacter aerophilus TaxID=1868324 RepID=A0A395M283_9BACT|nr:MAG: biotin/lipoyl-binding protein [Candidatus Thermochlorobacter aerophilum]
MKYQATVYQSAFEVEPLGSDAVSINGARKDSRLVQLSERFYHFIYDGKVYRVEAIKTDDGFNFKINGELVSVDVKDELQLLLDKMGGNAKKKSASGDIKAPMPGLVVKLSVSVGESVKKGQGLLILEAMKMQNEIKSPMDGVVKEIKVSEKQAVEKNYLLMKLE